MSAVERKSYLPPSVLGVTASVVSLVCTSGFGYGNEAGEDPVESEDYTYYL